MSDAGELRGKQVTGTRRCLANPEPMEVGRCDRIEGPRWAWRPWDWGARLNSPSGRCIRV